MAVQKIAAGICRPRNVYGAQERPVIKLHIGFVTTESPYGDGRSCGVAAYLRALIPALVEGGHRITVFADSAENKEFQVENGRVVVQHFRLPQVHGYAAKVPGVRGLATLPLRQLEWSAAFYRRVSKTAAVHKIDVLESAEAGALFLSRIAPLVLRLHGSEFAFRKYAQIAVNSSVRWNDALEAISSRRATVITTPSHFQAQEIVNHRGWPTDRVRVIPNPISSTMLKAARLFQRNGNSESIVLYTGRLAQVKGIETLLDAAKQVHQENPGITFVLAGPWQMPQSPESYGLELGRRSIHGVKWIGSQEQNEIVDWYKRASVFVMPSHYESFGISVVEAMAFGLPVVCSRAGAIPETVDDGVTGLLVEPGNSTQFAQTILQLLSDGDRRTTLGRAGQARDFRKFIPAEVARQSLEVYQLACGSSGVPLK